MTPAHSSWKRHHPIHSATSCCMPERGVSKGFFETPDNKPNAMAAPPLRKLIPLGRLPAKLEEVGELYMLSGVLVSLVASKKRVMLALSNELDPPSCSDELGRASWASSNEGDTADSSEVSRAENN